MRETDSHVHKVQIHKEEEKQQDEVLTELRESHTESHIKLNQPDTARSIRG